MNSCADPPRWWAPLILSDADVRAHLRLDHLVDLQREAFVVASRRSGVATPRAGVVLGDGALTVASMTALAPDGQTVTTKVLASAHGNRALGLPRSSSTLVVLDVPTGRPRAILDGTYLTNARTAAAAVLALETLRAGAPDAPRRLGLFGAGPIAELVLAVLATRPGPWRVDVFAPTKAHRIDLAERGERAYGLAVRAVPRPDDASDAPHVIFATDGRQSAVAAGALAPHGVVVSIASRRATSEIPRDALVDAILVVDDRHAAVAETGEFSDADPASLVELGELLAGTVSFPETDDPVRRVHKATGLAIQDAVVCSHLLENLAGRGSLTS